MPRLLPFCLTVCTILLVGCGTAKDVVQATLSTDTDATRTVYLLNAAERVLESRLIVAGYQKPVVKITPTGPTTASIALPVVDDAMRTTAENLLAEKFQMDFRLENEKAEKTAPDRWVPTGIDQSHIDWVTPIGDRSSGAISIELALTPEGRTKLRDVFRTHKGQSLGIFVRDLLMSKITIPSTPLEDRIVISGVPSEKAAEIFAVDVNVGLHVTFAPLP